MTTETTVTPKVSWLKKLGQGIVKVLGVLNPIEKAAEPIVEALLPISTVGFKLFDYIVAQVTNVEAGYAAISSAPTGVAKFNAVLPLVANALDTWVAENLPGSSQILVADTYLQSRTLTATNLTNTVVSFLNSLPVLPNTTPTTSSGLATAAIMKQIATANPSIAASVITGAHS